MTTPTIAPTITIFVRYAEGFKQTREDFKQCNCKKHLRWSHNGKQFRKAAGTRSWAEAVQRGREIEDRLSGRPVEGKTEAPKSVDEAARLFLR